MPHQSKSRCEQRDRPAAFAAGKPFGHGLGRAWPVRGFSGAQQESKDAERAQPAGERCGHRRERIEHHGDRQAGSSAKPVQQRPGTHLPKRVSNAEGNDDQREVGVRPGELRLQVRSENAERLPVDVVDDVERKGARRCPSPAPVRPLRMASSASLRMMWLRIQMSPALCPDLLDVLFDELGKRSRFRRVRPSPPWSHLILIVGSAWYALSSLFRPFAISGARCQTRARAGWQRVRSLWSARLDVQDLALMRPG